MTNQISMPDSKKDFVIALGGSIMHPDEINIAYIKEFYDFVGAAIGQGMRFIIVVGGGALTRKFQRAAAEITSVTDDDKDWLGIHTTRLNAHLLRTVFRRQAHPVIMDERYKLKNFDGHRVIIGAGWRPGWSTDFVAVQIAADFGIGRTIILGKPEFVYDKDNQKFPDARPFEKLNWEDYLELIPNEWSPGMHAPVDPVAARLARKENIEVIVAGGRDLANVQNILEGGKFKGTVLGQFIS